MILKQCEIVNNQDMMTVDIQEVCNKYSTIKQWAYILHDKDGTRPHYHIYLNFGNSGVDTNMIASWFGLAGNFVSKVKGRKADMLLYLTHGNESQKNKYQYNISDVVSNFDFVSEIEKDKILGDFEKFSYAEQIVYVHNLPLEYREKEFKRLENLWKLECKFQAQKVDRNIDVIFITGESGTGKTTFAKELCNKFGYDYCVSSSNNDPFQDYQGQKAMILDDLRDSVFSLTDLLKILDNNTASSVRSRFNNKVFNGKLIIITSCKSLSGWYCGDSSSVSKESLYQLYRRISTYIEITKDTIYSYDEIKKDGFPNSENIITYPNIVSEIYPKVNKPNELSDNIYNLFKSDIRFVDSFNQEEKFKHLGLFHIKDDEYLDKLIFN